MKLAGVVGFPVCHSRSPALHGYWLKHYKIDGAYVPLAVTPDDLKQTLEALPKMGFVGVNLTIPHKENAFAICTALGVVDAIAQKIGAVNTLVFGDGKIIKATNTDGYGFIANIKDAAHDWQPETSRALVLGAGGAARGIIAALLSSGVPSIEIINRTRAKAETLAALFPNVTVGDWEKPAKSLANTNLLINTTSLGMSGEPPLTLPLNDLPQDAFVTDIVYNPLHTELLKNAAARGNMVVDGLGMLLHQGAPAFERWFGIPPEVTQALRTCVLEA